MSHFQITPDCFLFLFFGVINFFTLRHIFQDFLLNPDKSIFFTSSPKLLQLLLTIQFLFSSILAIAIFFFSSRTHMCSDSALQVFTLPLFPLHSG
jgi:hypothetical protein